MSIELTSFFAAALRPVNLFGDKRVYLLPGLAVADEVIIEGRPDSCFFIRLGIWEGICEPKERCRLLVAVSSNSISSGS